MNFIYLLPATNTPHGGIRVSYKHNELLNSSGYHSSICHPEDLNFSCSWFSHNAQLKKDLNFEIDKDFIIIPEIWAQTYGLECKNKNIRYAIFVQNAYSMISLNSKNDYGLLENVYENADAILSISVNTSELIKLAFPKLDEEKIFRIIPNINPDFKIGIKKRTITYMPRKLEKHTKLLDFYIKNNLPANWELIPISGLTEKELLNLFSESSIFLSFSELEGCPAPPLEAAFSGNLVVGYTGQGANEYFKKPIFYAVQNGNFKNFIEEILVSIDKCEKNFLNSDEHILELSKIKNIYSQKNELEHLINFAKNIVT